MDELGADAFPATQRSAAKKDGSTNPRRPYLQAADVELSAQGLAWLPDRLQAALDAHGTVPNDLLAAIRP